MTVVAIKDYYRGTYYAGCGKREAKTLLGAQLYKSRKAAQHVIDTSTNFHIRTPEIVEVILREAKEAY